MVRYHDTLWCDGCGVEIYWKPSVKDQRNYCCERCLKGEVCDCAEAFEQYTSRSSRRPEYPADLPLNHLADVY